MSGRREMEAVVIQIARQQAKTAFRDCMKTLAAGPFDPIIALRVVRRGPRITYEPVRYSDMYRTDDEHDDD